MIVYFGTWNNLEVEIVDDEIGDNYTGPRTTYVKFDDGTGNAIVLRIPKMSVELIKSKCEELENKRKAK